MKDVTVLLIVAANLMPAIVGLLRFNTISKKYYPFIYFVWLGGLVELGNSILIKNGLHTTEMANVYVFLSSILLAWFFYGLRTAIKRKGLFYLIVMAFTIFWFVESFVYRDLSQISSYFRIFFSFVLVLISISCINYLLTSYTGNLVKNAIFLICVGIVFYYTIKVLVETFWLYGLKSSDAFQIQVYHIMPFVDVLTNIIFAFAILWIPKKQPFIQPF